MKLVMIVADDDLASEVAESHPRHDVMPGLTRFQE